MCTACQPTNDRDVLAYQFIGLVVWTPQLLWALLCWWSYRWQNISFTTASCLIFLPAMLLGPALFGALKFYFMLAWPAYVLTLMVLLLRFLEQNPE
ncbi:hypothetical protein [Hymenobacter jeollabukensis]|uniref:Uncharacterized protein n=1 Tax=Hymenobacter jeollabukensis TaxID=2025313 RepID=A0A5R8WP60_9BACT|nr:hypothetical protein [Hymenobacter jeollabukensis]TLM91834.1 hypothetical protein FDY95_14850 [Hymenobacter jeollabukensis]